MAACAGLCSHCNNGQVTQGGSSGDNDTWRGPFGSPAQAYAKVAGRADVADCSFGCLPDGG